MNDPLQPVFPWWPEFCCVLSSFCLLGALREGKRRRLVDNLPTSKTTGVFIGLVELKGTAEVDAPLTSYLSACRCVHYSWEVKEEWEGIVGTKTCIDSDGKSQTLPGTDHGWTTVASGGGKNPFYLHDDCGAVLVRPKGAEIEAPSGRYPGTLCLGRFHFLP